VRQVRLERSGLVTSRLAFGTSRLHHIEARARRHLIEIALEAGIVHFDTAPAYGDTLAERELGAALASVRERVVIATKFGIPANALAAAAPSFGTPVRAARALARRAGLFASKRVPMTPDALRRSVEGSLRRLGTDRIDLLLLHEPDPASVPAPEQMLDALQGLQRSGLIGHFGLAGEWPGIAALDAPGRRLGVVVQTSEQQWPEAFPPDLTYGAIAAAPQSYLGGPAISSVSAEERLVQALRRRPDGAVIVSTTNAVHLARLARAADAT
jgi:aryl-alcohol dehydrogenase-like predicted oxidoreductase